MDLLQHLLDTHNSTIQPLNKLYLSRSLWHIGCQVQVWSMFNEVCTLPIAQSLRLDCDMLQTDQIYIYKCLNNTPEVHKYSWVLSIANVHVQHKSILHTFPILLHPEPYDPNNNHPGNNNYWDCLPVCCSLGLGGRPLQVGRFEWFPNLLCIDHSQIQPFSVDWDDWNC